jgi:hypothetical protein
MYEFEENAIPSPPWNPHSVLPDAVVLLGACRTGQSQSNRCSLCYVNPNLTPLELSCSMHPRRPTMSDSLEGRLRKAGLGWVGIFNVASTLPCTYIGM